MNAKIMSSSSNLHLLLHKSDYFPTNLTKPITLRPKFSIKTSSSCGSPLRSSVPKKGLTLKAFYVMPTLTQQETTFYDLLGIPETGTISDIKKAYKQLARKYHPDVSPPESSEEYTKKFIMVKEAYETLSDPQSRAVYDLDLIRGGARLPFSSARRSASGSGEGLEEEWKSRWQNQLNELKWKQAGKDSAGKASWGARMRHRKNSVFDLGL